MSQTVLDGIQVSLGEALHYNENAEVAPVALLWPDPSGQFAEAAEALRAQMPLLTLGEFDPVSATGPAYWIRCAIAGTVEASLPQGTPVIYLRGVARDELRAVEDCPPELAPIAELQYRGEWFAHPNGRDWTVRGFLSNDQAGLGLAVAADGETGEALDGAFSELLHLPIRRLTSQFINADFLQRLLNPDPVARLLEWLDDPQGFLDRVDEPQWKAFLAQTKSEFGFDPSAEGEVTGGRLLGERDGSWSEVWQRFAEDPERYSGVEARLRKGRPHDLFPGLEGSWPQDNEEAEAQLHRALKELEGVPRGEARDTVGKLWDQHRHRRNWVWAKLDQAPLAFALEQLHRLTELTSEVPGETIQDLKSTYARSGWQADDAFLSALQAAPKAPDRNAVAAAAAVVYRPWVEAHARALQEAIGPLVNAGTYSPAGEAALRDSTVTVFVDGLRLDLAHRLADRLGRWDVSFDTALAALPTVTQTAKPAITPVPEGSLTGGPDFSPARSSSGARANINVLRTLMQERGLQILQGAETGDPSGSAWTEAADIDRRGHDFGVPFVDEIDRELDDIGKRIRLLLEAGWGRVDVVTDHGWLLLPGGLEKIELAAATVEKKKGRCARLKEGADVAVPTIPWYWDSNVQIALAPGIGCFEANQEYEHGGVSLQECVVPRLSVTAGEERAPTGGAAITKVKWLGLMCRVRFENVAPGATVDIRAMPADPSTSVAETAKETSGAGKQSLHVPDEELEGEKAYVVVVGNDGGILAQRGVTIGLNR